MSINEKDDEKIGKAYDSQLMKRLLAYVKPYYKFVMLGIIANLIFSALGPLRPYLTQIAIDDKIASGDKQGLFEIALLILAVLIFQAAVQYVLTYYTQYMGQKIIYDLRVKIFKQAQKLSLKYFDKTPIGRIVTRVTNDVESLNELFSSGIVTVFSDIFLLLWIVGFMFYISWDLALATLAVLPLLMYATFLFRRKVRESYRKVRLNISRLNSFMQEHVTGMHVVQLFNREKREKEKFNAINKDLKDANIDSIFYYAVFFPFVEFSGSLAVALILWYGSGQIFEGVMTLGVLVAYIQYTEMFFRPIRDLSEKYNIMQTAMASSERVFNLLDDQTIIPEPEKPIKLENVKGEIEFKNVWFAYKEEEFVLRDISFKIEAAQSVAIVGATGAGKTSIINVLNKFYMIQKGAVFIDGISITDVTKHDLRSYISTVLQDVFLFSGTIKFNITLGNENITDEMTINAAKTVGVHDFIMSLPNGYNEQVMEKGSSLSVGQKQLISFARALAYEPKILILDEATSSIDTDTEILIKNATKKLLKGRTSIVIAHRLSTIQSADKIIVMHKGKIREIGNHQELLANKGIYYKLYQLQYKEQEI